MTRRECPDENGRFGEFGGRYVPETLYTPLLELEKALKEAFHQADFIQEFQSSLRSFVGRPTPLYFAERLTNETGGARIYLKREDLAHTGAHKINNALGQAILARRMGKTRIVAETGAGQHGVATASACARLGLECVIYMGEVDMERQSPNVKRMRLLGAEVRGVSTGQKTLKDAVSAAMRDWVENLSVTHYLLGSALGPHPYPWMVREFQKVIGEEAKEQIINVEKRLPGALVACVGGGSNAIGLFYPFLNDVGLEFWGVEAGGSGPGPGKNAARISKDGSIGVLQGTRTFILQDEDGQILPTESISAGLDYPAIGPEHADLYSRGIVKYVSVTDQEALSAFRLLSRLEGIIPALESAHAVSHAMKIARTKPKSETVLVGLSGRGDKDLGNLESAYS